MYWKLAKQLHILAQSSADELEDIVIGYITTTRILGKGRTGGSVS